MSILVDEMHNKKNTSETIEKDQFSDPDVFLVLGIDKNGKIIQFNKECEKITGFNRFDALEKKLFEFLVPDKSFEQWKNMFYAARKNEDITDFDLPVLTNNGREVLISWSNFPIQDLGGDIDNFCLVGKLSDAEVNSDILLSDKKDHPDLNFDEIEPDIKNHDKSDKPVKNKVLFKIGNKKIVFKKTKSSNKSKTKKGIKSQKKSKKHISKDKKTVPKKVTDGNFKKEDVSMSKDKNSLLEENKGLKKEKNKLERKLKNLSSDNGRIKDEKGKDFQFSSKRLDLLGKAKKEEFEKMLEELEKRNAYLDGFESDLNREKEILDLKSREFVKWREKLEVLEEEIEKRREDVIFQENALKARLFSSIDDAARYSVDTDVEDVSGHHEFLDKIPEGAFIIQRGILKQVNSSFVDLIGYEADEVVDKSLFDFIAPEGFSDIREYFLNRLKGNEINRYGTVFVTKNNKNISVEVSVKPTVFEKEKADISIVKKVRIENIEKE